MTPRVAFHRFIERHEVVWELAFGLLAAIFVGLAFIEPSDEAGQSMILAIEWGITAIFAVEFVARLWAAPHRAAHLRGHWIDLVSLIPPTRWLRPLRLLRLLRLIRTFTGIARAMSQVPRLANHQGLVWLVVAWVGVTMLSSVALYIAEHEANPAVDDPLDALWWGITTLSTVGYGDVYPMTPEGRVAAMVLMILGIGLYSAITAAVTSYFVNSRSQPESPLVDELERLAKLRDSFSLSEEEFGAAKAMLMDRVRDQEPDDLGSTSRPGS